MGPVVSDPTNPEIPGHLIERMVTEAEEAANARKLDEGRSVIPPAGILRELLGLTDLVEHLAPAEHIAVEAARLILDGEHTPMAETAPTTVEYGGRDLPMADHVGVKAGAIASAIGLTPCLVFDFGLYAGASPGPATVEPVTSVVFLAGSPDVMRRLGKLVRDGANTAANRATP